MSKLLKEASKMSDSPLDGLSQRVLRVLQTSEVLYKPSLPNNLMVFKCAADIVVKVTQHVDDDTEYTTLQYIECHKPTVPAPRLLGYV